MVNLWSSTPNLNPAISERPFKSGSRYLLLHMIKSKCAASVFLVVEVIVHYFYFLCIFPPTGSSMILSWIQILTVITITSGSILRWAVCAWGPPTASTSSTVRSQTASSTMVRTHPSWITRLIFQTTKLTLCIPVCFFRHAGTDVLGAGGHQWQASVGPDRNRHLLLQVGLCLTSFFGLWLKSQPYTTAVTCQKNWDVPNSR